MEAGRSESVGSKPRNEVSRRGFLGRAAGVAAGAAALTGIGWTPAFALPPAGSLGSAGGPVSNLPSRPPSRRTSHWPSRAT